MVTSAYLAIALLLAVVIGGEGLKYDDWDWQSGGDGYEPFYSNFEQETSSTATELSTTDTIEATATTAAPTYHLCSSYATAPTIKVFTQKDILTRVKYSPFTTVKLILMNSITTTRPIVMGRNFSCTVFFSTGAGGYYGYTLSYWRNDKPALIVTDAANILMYRVGFGLRVSTTAASCTGVPTMETQLICPGVSIYRSYGVQLARAKVMGRIDLIKTSSCSLDNLYVRAVGVRKQSPGVISIAQSGIGPQLVYGNNLVANCDIAGLGSQTEVGINLYFGAIGNRIVNNYVHNWLLFGISCGWGVHSSGSCMLNSISRNFVYNPISILKEGYTADSAGIYFNLHWLGVGNTLTCNYVQGPGHCYYFDYCTSGVFVYGGACIDNDDGFKVNTGKMNYMRDVVMVRTKHVRGFISCQNYFQNNCLNDPGNYWDQLRLKYFNTPTFNARYPWLSNFCSQKTFGGRTCNPGGSLSPSAQVTGACSGIPTGNNLHWIDVNPVETKKVYGGYRNCDNTTVVERFNVIGARPYAKGRIFYNYYINDFGVRAGSSLFANGYKFISCPRSTIGPKAIAFKTVFPRWNIPAPVGWQSILNYKLVSP